MMAKGIKARSMWENKTKQKIKGKDEHCDFPNLILIHLVSGILCVEESTLFDDV